MIDFDKLDKISELPISEEMLGAYLEGNLDLNEAAAVESMIDASPTISEIFDECSVITDNTYSMPFDENIQVDNIDLAELDPRDDIDADAISDDLDRKQENTELNPTDDFDKYFNNGDTNEDGMSDDENDVSSEGDNELGLDNGTHLDVFTDDLHEICEDGSDDFSLDANFSDQE